MNQKIYRFKQDQPFNRIEKYFGNEWNKVLRDGLVRATSFIPHNDSKGRKREKKRDTGGS